MARIYLYKPLTDQISCFKLASGCTFLSPRPEMRDGVSFSMIEKRKPLLTPADLAGLANLEAYVKLPDSDVKLVKLNHYQLEAGRLEARLEVARLL